MPIYNISLLCYNMYVIEKGLQFIEKMKGKVMKKFFAKLNYWFTWLFSRNVLNAINEGQTYEEVDEIARKEAEHEKDI